MARVLAIVLVLCLLAGCESAGSGAAPKAAAAPGEFVEKSAERGPVKLTVRVSPKEPRLSDMLDLDLSVDAALDVEVKAPVFGQAVGEFIIRDYNEHAARVENDRRIRRFHYRLEATEAGKHLIRSMGVEFIDRRAGTESKGEAVLIETEPLEVTVTSELGDATPTLADLAPMAPPVPLPARPLPAWAIALLGAGAAGLIVLAFWWRRRRLARGTVAVQRTPEDIAREELLALLAEDLVNKGLAKEFYVRLTGIVRRYIERTAGIRAPEQTTEEFLRDMRSRKVFPPERAERLAQFLEAADMVKYAGQQPGQRQVQEAVARAQEFVGLTSALAPLPEKPVLAGNVIN